MKTKFLVLAFAVFCMTTSGLYGQFNPSPATPGVVYGGTGTNDGGRLITINPATGATSVIANVTQFGSGTNVNSINGLTVSPTGDILASVSLPGTPGGSAHLVQIDPANGQALVLGTITSTFDPINGLVYAQNGNLYGVSFFSKSVYIINPANGAIVSTVLSGTSFTFSGLAQDPTTGNIYASTNNGTIQRFDANMNHLGALAVSSPLPGLSDLFFDPSGNMYGTEGGNGGANLINEILSIDKNTGVVAVSGPTGLASVASAGLAGPQTVQPVPTLGQWGLIFLGLSILCLGAVVLWKARERFVATA